MKKNLTIDTIEAYKKVEERHTKDVENAYKLGQLDILEKLKAEFDNKILLNQTVAIQIIDKYTKELQDSIVKVQK